MPYQTRTEIQRAHARRRVQTLPRFLVNGRFLGSSLTYPRCQKAQRITVHARSTITYFSSDGWYGLDNVGCGFKKKSPDSMILSHTGLFFRNLLAASIRMPLWIIGMRLADRLSPRSTITYFSSDGWSVPKKRFPSQGIATKEPTCLS